LRRIRFFANYQRIRLGDGGVGGVAVISRHNDGPANIG
jgi:hypothetical protein